MKLQILDKDTGKELRVIDLPDGSQGIPVVYQVNGREYVAICTTGGNTPRRPVGAPQTRVYVAFALPPKK